MKTSHIVALIVIAIGAGILISVAGEFGSYGDFTTAQQAQGEKVQIVGHLSTSKDIVYDPQTDPNFFSFYMKDKNGTEKQVIYRGAKPQDFERSEQIVLTGAMKGDAFEATDILLKCPSKYKQNFTASK